jgi:hypothetical protein
MTHDRPPTHEPFVRTLARNVTIALLVGVALAAMRRNPSLALPATLVALWPSLGGHVVEIAFLAVVRPRIPPTRWVQAVARVVWWLAGGVVLREAMIVTARTLAIFAPGSAWFRMVPLLFVGLELLVHALLAARGRPSFYRGDG